MLQPCNTQIQIQTTTESIPHYNLAKLVERNFFLCLWWWKYQPGSTFHRWTVVYSMHYARHLHQFPHLDELHHALWYVVCSTIVWRINNFSLKYQFPHLTIVYTNHPIPCEKKIHFLIYFNRWALILGVFQPRKKKCQEWVNIISHQIGQSKSNSKRNKKKKFRHAKKFFAKAFCIDLISYYTFILFMPLIRCSLMVMTSSQTYKKYLNTPSDIIMDSRVPLKIHPLPFPSHDS